MRDILRASTDDAEHLLALQKAAYAAEARLYDDWTIAPLTETVEEVRAEIRRSTVLKCVEGNVIVGSVRGEATGDACRIGRLFVSPDRQGQGIGSALLCAIEAAFPDSVRFELFTGSRSEGNIRLYRRHGYVITGETSPSPKLTLVFLEKTAA